MRLELGGISRRLDELKKSPEEVFPFFVPSKEDIDRGVVLDLAPSDEAAILAGTLRADSAIAKRRTSIVSCSALTHELYVQALDRHLDFEIRNAGIEARRKLEFEKTGKADDSPLPQFEEWKPRQMLSVLQARILAEGIEAWEPPPQLVLDAPSVGLKRGAKLKELLSAYLPPDPFDVSSAAHQKLLQVVEALPNRYVERVFCGIFWVSQLLPARFLPAEAPRGDAGKPSGKPSPSPSSAPAPSSRPNGAAGT